MKYISLIFTLLMCIGVAGCRRSSDYNTHDSEKGILKYSRLLKVDRQPDCTVVEIRTKPETAKPVARYALVKHDNTLSAERLSELSADGIKAQCIKVPVKNMVIYSSVYAGPLKELGRISIVKGVADAEYFKLPEIQTGLSKGTIADVGPAHSPSAETMIDMGAEVIMMTLYEGMDAPDPKAGDAVTVKMADTLEDTPLGRAEWIRFLGMLTCTESLADSIFAQVEQQYTALSAQGRKARSKPKVMVENMYQGVWAVPGGASYAACMLADAGAVYPWSDIQKNGSLQLSYEEVYSRCADADFWFLKLYGTELTPGKLTEMDKRYNAFACVRAPQDKGGVYYVNTQTSYLFEEFPFHPELMLADYLGILHPELPGAAKPLRYFKRMPNK